MEPRYFYIDAAGIRSGPYSETDLERLAEIGGIDWAGSIELEGLGRTWRITEVGWLADAMMRTRGRRRGVVEGTARPLGDAPEERPTEGSEVPPPPGFPPPDAPAEGPWPQEERRAMPPTSMPPTSTPPTSMPWPPLPAVPSTAACSRTTYILLGLLPAFVGLFGVNNLVAGYMTRGVVQLALSIFTIGGTFGALLMAPCCCFGIPLWAVMFVWMVFEIVTVTRDARGLPMQ
jgi:hypothetical protein